MEKKKRLTPDEAIQFLNEVYQTDKDVVTKKALYNAVWEKKMTNYGRNRHALYDQDELLKAFGRPESA